MRTLTQPLNMSPGGIPPVIHVSQYDSDFTIVFTLFSTVGDFTIEAGTTAMVRGTKSSGTGYSADAAINISAKTVTVTGNAQMTAAAGQNVFEIVLKRNNKEISSKNFILLCERAALDMDTIEDQTIARELDNLDQFVEAAEDAADRAEAAAQTLVIDSTPTQGSAHAVSSGGVWSALEKKGGLSEDVKVALLACFQHVAWTDEHGQDYYDALEEALYTNTYPKLSVELNLGSHIVFTDDSLDSLKTYLTVTYFETESSSGEIVNNYSLSGSLANKENTIIATYNNSIRESFVVHAENRSDWEYVYPSTRTDVITGTTEHDGSDDRYLVVNTDSASKLLGILNSDIKLQQKTTLSNLSIGAIPIPTGATGVTVILSGQSSSNNYNYRLTFVSDKNNRYTLITWTADADSGNRVALYRNPKYIVVRGNPVGTTPVEYTGMTVTFDKN